MQRQELLAGLGRDDVAGRGGVGHGSSVVVSGRVARQSPDRPLGVVPGCARGCRLVVDQS
jgi:hypothetical protein